MARITRAAAHLSIEEIKTHLGPIGDEAEGSRAGHWRVQLRLCGGSTGARPDDLAHPVARRYPDPAF